MNRVLSLVVTFAALSVGITAQPSASNKTSEKPASNVSANASPIEIANAVFAAHGGEKFKNVKTMVIRGSVDVTSSSFNQAIVGGFAMVFAGDKYRVELANPIQSFKQSFDGEQTRTSIQTGFALPPLNRLGIPLLQRLGTPGYVVSKLPDSAKKKSGFRITAPDGFFTDFYIDEKSSQLKGYESQYDFNGRTFTTSVTIEKYRAVDGIAIPERFSQRFDLGQIIVYGAFKAKDILINSELAADVFSSAN